jgi:hypothetical protein
MDLLDDLALLRAGCAALLVRSTALHARSRIWEEQTAQLTPIAHILLEFSVRAQRQRNEIAYWANVFALAEL